MSILSRVWDGLAAWWGSVELWLTQRVFPVQFVLFMVVVAPLCAGVTVLLDRAGDAVAGRRRRRTGRDAAGRSRA